jgi:methylenetetrahydrofolate dehydrogenase (NADP+)/methenyltetrahydrofolate cyclohydrolase
MSARRLDGAAAAARFKSELIPRVAAFTAARGRAPALSIVLAGDDPASQVYVRNKEKAGVETGLHVSVHRLPPDTTAAAVLALVRRLNDDESCDGILVQSPLPPGITRAEAQVVFDAIDPAKDVDGFHPRNVGLLVQGRASLAPCTPSGVMALLEMEQIPIAGRRAVIIGRSEIVGKPMALLLLAKDATVTVCHSKTRDLAAIAAEADILVAAIGRPAFVTPDFVKPGATVIDVGINRVDKRLAGDVHPDVASVAGALTPVPGGVGPLTIAMLLRNTLIAAEGRAEAGGR